MELNKNKGKNVTILQVCKLDKNAVTIPRRVHKIKCSANEICILTLWSLSTTSKNKNIKNSIGEGFHARLVLTISFTNTLSHSPASPDNISRILWFVFSSNLYVKSIKSGIAIKARIPFTSNCELRSFAYSVKNPIR